MIIKIKLNLLFTLFLLATTLCANDTLFLLPKESKQAVEKIETLMSNAESSIDIAMYNFSLKSFAKILIEAKKRGVKVRVFLDEEKAQNKSSEYALLKKNGIDIFLISNTKLHTKLAIIDQKVAIFGSSNWTKESFDENYEIIYISEQKEMIEKFNHFLEKLKEK
ncbi:MAG: phospholipase D-like domain-containing protein [Arcobacteraceae bacterium]